MMKYLRLFRWPNILIIILTMTLVRYYLVRPVLLQQNIPLQMPLWQFVLLVLSVVLIAVAGYVINDYFDLRIDNVNDPERVILGKNIPIRRAIPMHATFTALGVACGTIVAFAVGNFKLMFVHLIIGLLLWLYSARYKRRPFWGNLIVAFSSAMVILIVWLFEIFAMAKNGVVIVNRAELTWIHLSVLFMAGFAFVISLVREMVKDIEDMEGDKRYGCRTLPVVLEVKYVKVIILVLMALSMGVLGYVQYHLMAIHFNLTSYYLFVVQFLMAYFIYMLLTARGKQAYNALSQLALIIMLSGILSMQIYYINQ